MKKIIPTIVACILILAGATAWTQQPPGGPGLGGPPPHGGGGPPGSDAISENLFPAEIVMRNQKAIALTEAQQASLKAEMQKTMARFTELQWQGSAEQETMASLVNQAHPDEKQVVAQLDKLLNIENEMKRLHLTTLIRIKNLLTPDQQAKLRQLQKQDPPQRPPGPPPLGENGPQSSSGRPSRPPRPGDAEQSSFSEIFSG